MLVRRSLAAAIQVGSQPPRRGRTSSPDVCDACLRCRRLRADPALHDIPIFLLTAPNHPSVATTGQAAGATLTLQKPHDNLLLKPL